MGRACFVACCLFLTACSGGDPACSLVNPCVEGFACDAEQHCVAVAPLKISTRLLQDAVLGLPYQALLEAEGGLPPYAWRIECEAGWLTVDPEQGRLSGTPDAPVENLAVVVKVTDGRYVAPAQTETQLSLRVAGCNSGDTIPCYTAQLDRCLQGHSLCLNGSWGDCDNLSPSTTVDHCGADCSLCDTTLADECVQGRCLCGGAALCQAPLRCCVGACVDLEQSTEHCGACGQDCNNQTQNAEGLTCNQGACDYATCQHGFLDCDANRENGCETAMDADHCGGCEETCPDLPHISARVCQLEVDTWVCGYDQCLAEWLDCDLEQPGCETARGPASCAACLDDCGIGENDHACVQDPESGDYRCGCVDESHCSETHRCCDAHCVWPNDLEHCGSCGNNCYEQIENVETVICAGMPPAWVCHCTFDRCLSEWMNCDGSGGCETTRDADHCQHCNDDCSESTLGNACIMDITLGGWHCGCDGDGDCETDQQCCDHFCYDINDPQRCGACNVDCALDPRGPSCIDSTIHQCGCDEIWGCEELQICCDEQCVEEDENNCGTCGNVCSVENRGPVCSLVGDRCYCRDDPDCDLSALSAGECTQSGPPVDIQRCNCPGTSACAGGQNDQCCDLGDETNGCVDLETDENNCGGCGISCLMADPDCRNGSCHCEGASAFQCGLQRTADYCSETSFCACTNFSSGTEPRACTLGRYCCDGSIGGNGGPGGGADRGCCWGPCGNNVAGACVTEE